MIATGCSCHAVPGGSDLEARIRRTGYLYGRGRWRLAENLLWAAGRRATPQAVRARWMRSRVHRDAILDRGYRETGVGVVRGAPSSGRSALAATYVVDFGWRR